MRAILGCGRISDVQGPATEPHSRALCGRVAAQSGFSVTYHRIEFYGRCPECQRRAVDVTLPAQR